MATARVEWNSKAILALVKQITQEQENGTARRIWANAIVNVPVGKYGSYRYPKRRVPFVKRKDRIPRPKKDWMRRSPGTLMRSIKKLKSKYPEGGQLVWAGNERLVYYSHFIEFGTVYMQKRRGYKFMRRAIDKEKRSFLKQLQVSFQGDMRG